jgi:hypothetical protein
MNEIASIFQSDRKCTDHISAKSSEHEMKLRISYIGQATGIHISLAQCNEASVAEFQETLFETILLEPQQAYLRIPKRPGERMTRFRTEITN